MSLKEKTKIFLYCLAAVYLVAIIGSLSAISALIPMWSFSPFQGVIIQGWFFPVVWFVFYFFIAWSLYLAWTHSNVRKKKAVAITFGINLLLNLLWFLIFFAFRQPEIALYEILVLVASGLSVIVVSFIARKSSTLAFIPYFLWVCFAAILNFSIFK